MRFELSRKEFNWIDLKVDPDKAFNKCNEAIKKYTTQAETALSICNKALGMFGVESIELRSDYHMLYVNTGDLYKTTICYTNISGYFVATCGDVLEAFDRDTTNETYKTNREV